MNREKNDLTLKIFAFLIAMVLWIYVMDEVNPEETREYKNINVTFNNEEVLDRQGLRVMEPKEVTVTVEVSAKRSDMAEFSPGSIRANLDLSGYGEGEKKIPIKVELDESSKIKITNWEPKEVWFSLDKLITKERQVTIKTEGELEPGYILGDLGTEFQTISLKGPRSWVDEVAEVVAIVNLDGRRGDGNVTVPVKILNHQGNDVRGVEKEPNNISIGVPILRTTKVPIELVTKNQLAENYEIVEVEMSPKNIDIKGNKDILNLKSIQTKAVDISNLVENMEIEVELDLPEGVQLLDQSQEIRVKLKIQKSIEKSFSYKLDEMRIENLDPSLSIEEDELLKDIEITLKGNEKDIEKLTKEDLELYIDLNTFTEGLNQVYINFNVPTGISVKEINPQPIEILLVKD